SLVICNEWDFAPCRSGSHRLLSPKARARFLLPAGGLARPVRRQDVHGRCPRLAVLEGGLDSHLLALSQRSLDPGPVGPRYLQLRVDGELDDHQFCRVIEPGDRSAGLLELAEVSSGQREGGAEGEKDCENRDLLHDVLLRQRRTWRPCAALTG